MTGRIFFKYLIVFACVVFWGSSPVIGAVSHPMEEILIGIEPEHNIFDQMQRYRFLADYLSDQLGVKVRLTIMSRYGEVLKRFRGRNLDGAFLSSYTAVLGIREMGLRAIASPVNLNGESTSRGFVFVRKDSDMRNGTDFRQKSMVFVDPSSMEGYLFPLAYFHAQGMKDPAIFFSRYYFSGSHASTIFAVLDGRADIGAAKDTVYNRLVDNDPSIGMELEVLQQSAMVPETTLCVRSELDRDFREKLSAILLHMEKTSRGKKVLKQFEALRFIKTKNEDFSKIEEMARESGVPIADPEHER